MGFVRLEQKADAEEVLPSIARRQLSCLHPEGLTVLLVTVVEAVIAEFKVVGMLTEAIVVTEELEWPMAEIDTDVRDKELLIRLSITDVDVELALP